MKTLLITGSTDGIGLATAILLGKQGHNPILHGRNEAKLAAAQERVAAETGHKPTGFTADLSDVQETQKLAARIKASKIRLDAIINNAGVFKIPEPFTAEGLDKRFLVNTIAPYILVKELVAELGDGTRIVNVSSAAQAPVDLQALSGQKQITDDFTAYAQSKLAIAAWSAQLAQQLPQVNILAVNPGSYLASKMVKEGFGVAGNDLNIGANILARAATSEEFAHASGRYFDNDTKRFAKLHPAATNKATTTQLITTMEAIIKRLSH